MLQVIYSPTGEIVETKDIEISMPEIQHHKTPQDLEEENELLTAQLKAQTDRSDFMEDCIAEMAAQIYGGV